MDSFKMSDAYVVGSDKTTPTPTDWKGHAEIWRKFADEYAEMINDPEMKTGEVVGMLWAHCIDVAEAYESKATEETG